MPEANNIPTSTNPGQVQPLLERGSANRVRDYRPRGFKWVKAAAALAEGCTVAQAAEKADVSPAAVHGWKRRPKFQALMARYLERVERETVTAGIALKSVRLRKLNRQVARIESVMDQRAQALGQVPDAIGGDTGLIVHDVKGVGAGDAATVVDVYEFDAALDRAYRATLEQAAKEMGGAFDESGKLPGNTGGTLIINFPVISAADLEAVNNAPTIDLPPMARRLLQRPSDGAQR